ncbi:hypothetical protein DPMN_085711 [Dreissena polymorpha]|uniref:Uncharacterized protein n=1 Tax=Dreissena polymorpha TaxID=45954 RepID=A0A9D3YH01_DREPO|nr:hypothetical protein DPMN_085711 [Dreissena polymorpha]
MSMCTVLGTLSLLCSTVLVVSEPAPDISSLKITGCQCYGGKNTCTVEQIGYALRGRVIATFDSSSVRCTDEALTYACGTVYGWILTCEIPSTSGQFEVRYTGAQNQLYGKSFDRVALQSCSFGSRPWGAKG